jgi:hypothetical protein
MHDRDGKAAFLSITSIRAGMADVGNEREIGKDSRHPHFIWVVLLSAAALILIFIGALVLVGSKGKKWLAPPNPDRHPTSWLTQPSPPWSSPSLGAMFFGTTKVVP